MKKKAAIAILVVCLLATLGMYAAFLAMPPTPALPQDDVQAFSYTEAKAASFPASYLVKYSNPEAYVVILSIRTFAFTENVYSKAMDQTKPIVEEKAAEMFKQDVELTKTGEERLVINGHRAVRQKYEIRWPEVANVPRIIDQFQSSADIHAEMVLTAWFCHEDFKSVCVGYFYLPLLQQPTESLVESIQDVNTDGPNILPFVIGLVVVDVVIIAAVVKMTRKKEPKGGGPVVVEAIPIEEPMEYQGQ